MRPGSLKAFFGTVQTQKTGRPQIRIAGCGEPRECRSG